MQPGGKNVSLILEDGLRVGEVEPLPPWQSGRLKADQHTLAKALQDVFNDYPEYAALYPEPDWDDASWVAQRWLEVLPIPPEQKQLLLAAAAGCGRRSCGRWKQRRGWTARSWLGAGAKCLVQSLP